MTPFARDGEGRRRGRGRQTLPGLQLPDHAPRSRDPHAQSAAQDLEFEEAARLRDELKRLKLLDLEFANEVMTGAGEAAPARMRKAARAESAERFRKGRR